MPRESRRDYLRRIETAVLEDRNALAAVIEAVGFGWGQIVQLTIGGLTIVVFGVAVILVSSLSNDMGRSLEIANTSQALIPMSNFCGVALGNFVSGPVSDNKGRRLPILLGFLGVAIFQCLCAGAWDLLTIVPLMFLLGLSMAFGMAPIKVLSGELVPTERRIHASFVVDTMFSIGAAYAGFLMWIDDPSMKDLAWRWLLLVGAIPAVLALVTAYFFLFDSPFFLAMRHENRKAREVLDSLRRGNGNPDVPTHYEPPQETLTPSKEKTLATDSNELWENLAIVFGRRLIYTTLVMCYTEFVINFSYYGGMYAFAQVMPALKTWMSPAVSLIVSSFAEIPAYALSILVGMYMFRKSALILTILVTAFTIAAFAVAAAHLAGESGGWWETLLQSSVIGFKAAIQITWAIVRLYIVEIYSTRTRTLGLAVAISFGRSGSIVAPMTFELMLSTFGTLAIFWLMAGLNVANAVLVFFLPYETKGKALDDDDDDETEPLVKEG